MTQADIASQGRWTIEDPAINRDQILAIIRQRTERANRDLPSYLGQVETGNLRLHALNGHWYPGNHTNRVLYQFASVSLSF